MKRRKFHKKCAGGLDLTIDTTCSSDIVNLHPTKEEGAQWIEEGMCNIGKECEPWGDCRDDDANICDFISTDAWVKKSSLSWLGSDLKIKLRNVCTASSECKTRLM